MEFTPPFCRKCGASLSPVGDMGEFFPADKFLLKMLTVSENPIDV
jgi:hypothetical protein